MIDRQQGIPQITFVSEPLEDAESDNVTSPEDTSTSRSIDVDVAEVNTEEELEDIEHETEEEEESEPHDIPLLVHSKKHSNKIQPPVPRVYYTNLSEDSIILILDGRKAKTEDDEVCITMKQGCVTLNLLHGNVMVNGYKLRVSKEVNSFIGHTTHHFLIFEPQLPSTIEKGSVAYKNIVTSLEPLVSDETQKKSILETIRSMNIPTLSLILLKKWNSFLPLQWTLSHVARETSFKKANHWCSIETKPVPSAIGDSWDRTLENDLVPLLLFESSIFITGPASSGKTTLIKRILNYLMSGNEKWPRGFDQVILIDLDPGQSEFTPPGEISARYITVNRHTGHEPFLSEPFVNQLIYGHMDDCIISYYVGGIDVMKDVDSYLFGVKQVWNAVVKSPVTCPVFINSMGFVKGIGRYILTEAIAEIQPTNVVEIKESFDGGPDAQHASLFTCSLMKSWFPEPRTPPPPYDYVQLKAAVKKTSLVHESKKKSRNLQVAACFTNNIKVLRSHLSLVERVEIDIDKVAFCITSDFGILSYDTIVDSLHLSYVKLLHAKEPISGRLTNNLRVTYKVPQDHKVVGHGIIFAFFKNAADPKNKELVRIEVLPSHPDVFKEHTVNVIAKPHRVSLPVELRADCININTPAEPLNGLKKESNNI